MRLIDADELYVEKLINASDLIEWIMETYPDWCIGDIRSIVDHIYNMPTQTNTFNALATLDCISRQAAIDAIKQREWLTQTAKEILEEVMEQLPSVQPEPKWIPCSERLPEDSNFYIVTYKDYLVRYIWFSVMHGWEWQAEDQPVAWMPLPEPYKGE